MTKNTQNTLEKLLNHAKKLGATHAEAAAIQSTSLTAKCRLGKTEAIEHAQSQDFGLRVFINQKQAGVSISGPNIQIHKITERAIAMAKAAPNDPFCGIPQSRNPMPHDKLNLHDKNTPDIKTLQNRAKTAEEAGRAVKGITNSEGAEASWSMTESLTIATNGFFGQKHGTRHGVFAMLIAEKNGDKERDYDHAAARHAADLKSPEEIGENAANRAVQRLGAKPMRSANNMPVLLEARVARSLLYHLAAAASGEAIARGRSFLKDSLNQKIFGDTITITDDPLRPRAANSRIFDAEGTPCEPRAIVEKGALRHFFLDTPSAKELGMETTGHAAASPGSPPSPAPSNLHIHPGAKSPQKLIADMKEGVVITELIGMGVNPITGDYSRGAAGFRVEKGEIAYPVSEITIAGSLKEMFGSLIAANDLELAFALNAPSLLIPSMTIAGHAAP